MKKRTLIFFIALAVVIGCGGSAPQATAKQAAPAPPATTAFPQDEPQAWAIFHYTEAQDQNFETAYVHDRLFIQAMVLREQEPLHDPVGAAIGLCLQMVAMQYLEGVPLVKLLSKEPLMAGATYVRGNDHGEERGGMILTYRDASGRVRRIVADWPMTSDAAASKAVIDLFKPHAR